VYAIGGYNGQDYLSSMEKYDEERKEWITMSSMNMARCTLAAVPSPDY
jgi:influenza virus NS1A-binding protein